jgi:hypothetical protein
VDETLAIRELGGRNGRLSPTGSLARLNGDRAHFVVCPTHVGGDITAFADIVV